MFCSKILRIGRIGAVKIPFERRILAIFPIGPRGDVRERVRCKSVLWIAWNG